MASLLCLPQIHGEDTPAAAALALRCPSTNWSQFVLVPSTVCVRVVVLWCEFEVTLKVTGLPVRLKQTARMV